MAAPCGDSSAARFVVVFGICPVAAGRTAAERPPGSSTYASGAIRRTARTVATIHTIRGTRGKLQAGRVNLGRVSRGHTIVGMVSLGTVKPLGLRAGGRIGVIAGARRGSGGYGGSGGSGATTGDNVAGALARAERCPSVSFWPVHSSGVRQRSHQMLIPTLG